MNIMLTSIANLFAAIAVGVMGFAIQRGATCTVAAVAEVVSRRRFGRLASDSDIRQASGRRSPSNVGISSDTVGWMCIVRWSVV